MEWTARNAFAPRPDRRTPARPKPVRLSVESLDERALPSTFTVTTGANDGTGSLRQAILDSNATPGADTIAFDIGGGGVQTIQPTAALPDVTDAAVIDGTTQPGFEGSPLIVLNGSQAGSGVSGLTISAGTSTIRGLVINSYSGNGVVLQANGGDLIVGNYIGTDVTGTAALGNLSGVFIANTSSNNTVGGSAAEDRNLISGNRGRGTSSARTRPAGPRWGTGRTAWRSPRRRPMSRSGGRRPARATSSLATSPAACS
jgi:hypothetical protein